ncbi:PadR family transcriptional regulator [Pseudonocardia sp. CA-107938]|uniref:PadR family transcriptional regulator n=1 Tax=Pseudonocardia sp. CA-107938 TaxID=3240021 RepID=UPI003D93B2CC
MAKRRRVGNLLALAVLSALLQGDQHPYEIAARLRDQGKERDMAIKWGSLYTVIGNLAKHGLVVATGSERAGARPERTVYRITDEGRAELVDWIRELVGDVETERPRFVAGLSLLSALPPDEALALLRKRSAALDAALAEERARLAEELAAVDRLFLIEEEYAIAVLAAEADWVRGLVAELADGTFPRLAEWRAVYEEAAVDG